MVVVKRILIGFLSLLAQLSLLTAVVATSGTLMLNALPHAGSSVATILQNFSMDQGAVNLLIDEFMKDKDPRIAKQIEENKGAISQAIESLSTTAEFQDAISKPINQLTQGILAGSANVKVDFSQLARLIAAKVNTAAKRTVVTKQDLVDLKPKVLNIKELSNVAAQTRSKLQIGMLLWLLWILLLVALLYLKGRAVMKTTGIQLLFLGASLLILKFGAPFAAGFAIKNFSSSSSTIDILLKMVDSATAPVLNFAIVVLVLGSVLVGAERYMRRLEFHA